MKDHKQDPRPNIRDIYRVGRRTPSKTWLVKEAPGWKVVHRSETLRDVAEFLRGKGVDLETVSVLTDWPWQPIAHYIREGIEP